jgi:uncharacterized protein involved in outer membrane biogenesis
VRKIFLILLGLLFVAVIGIVVILMTLDLNAYKAEIEAEIEAATGREVTIAGNIRVAFIPTLALSIEDVTVAGVPGGSGDPFLELPEVLALVSIPPLASFDIVFERIRLIEPVVVLETAPDGQASWDILAAETSEADQGPPPSIKIDLVDLQDGRLIVRDGETVRRFENVDLWIEALGPDGPFEARGRFSHLGHAWTLDADVGRISRPQLTINLSLASGDDAQAKLAGTLATTNGVQGFSGQIEADAVSLSFLDPFLTLPPMPDTLRRAPLSLDTRVSVSAQALRLSDLSVTLGESNATGNAVVNLRDGVSIDLELAVSKLDVDAILAAAAMSEEAVEENGETASGEPPWPDDLALRAAFAVDAAIYRGSPVRQIAMDVTLAQGVWTFSHAKAQLPGGTSLSLAGSLAVEDDVPTFRGPVEITSDNLRGSLDWLGIATDAIPQDRLRRLDFFGDVTASYDVVALTGVDLSLDSSRLTGGLAARIDVVPTLTIDVVLDQLNLDAYLPQAEETTPDGEEPLSISLEPLAFFLSLVNLDLKARVDALTYNGVAIAGLQADGTLQDRRLVLRSLGAADVAGAALRVSGEVDPGEGSIALQMGVKADDAGGLLRLMGIELPIDPAKLGAVELVGDISGDEGQTVLRQRLQTDLGAASIDGTLIEPFGTTAFDGRIGLQSDSYRTLAAALGVELPDAADSAIALAADIATDGNQAEVDAVLDVLAMRLRGSGSASNIREQAVFDLRLQADHEELATLLRDLGVDGGFADMGPLNVGLVATGSRDLIDVTLAPSTLGRTDLRGTLGLYLSDEKPRIEARLEAGVLALDPILAAASGGTLGDVDENGAADQDGERWSHEEIDLDVLNGFEAHLELVAQQATLQGLVFASPIIVADVAGGRLKIERFDGGIFDGRVALSGHLAEGLPHGLALNVALADADMAKVLEHFAQSEAVTGRLYLDFAVEGRGLSQRDLVKTLEGAGTISLRNGTLQGIDLRRINDRLGELDDEVAIAALLAEAATGGETAITAADGTFAVAEGVVRSDDLKVLLDGGRADFVLTLDLPRWWIDLDGEAQLTGHAGAPTLPITLHGSIDNPERVVDTRALQGFLVQRAAETALRNLAGDEVDGATGTLLDVLTGETPEETTVPAPEAADPPIVAVPEKPEPPEAPLQTIFELLTNPGGDGAEGGGNQGNEGGLDTESLLQDLLNDLGN